MGVLSEDDAYYALNKGKDQPQITKKRTLKRSSSIEKGLPLGDGITPKFNK